MLTLNIDRHATARLARAIERARIEKPLIRKTCERGLYMVRSSNGVDWYGVHCDSDARTATCTCPASKPCKHIAAVVGYHSWLVSQEQKAAVVKAAPTAEQIKKDFSDLFGD